MLRWKTVKDTRERCFGANIVASSAVGEAALRTNVRISEVVEVGAVQYTEKHHDLGLPGCSRSVSNPRKTKKMR